MLQTAKVRGGTSARVRNAEFSGSLVAPSRVQSSFGEVTLSQGLKVDLSLRMTLCPAVFAPPGAIIASAGWDGNIG